MKSNDIYVFFFPSDLVEIYTFLILNCELSFLLCQHFLQSDTLTQLSCNDLL